MAMSGAGQIRKMAKPVGRGYERNLRAVSGDYEQDEMVYVPGFWAQSGWSVVLSLLGASSCALTWVFTLSPLARHADVWGLGPTLMFTFFMGPIFAAMPLKWYYAYRKQQRVMEGLEAMPSATRTIEEVLE